MDGGKVQAASTACLDLQTRSELAPQLLSLTRVSMLEWPWYALLPALILIVSSFFWHAPLLKPIDHASGHSPWRMTAKRASRPIPTAKTAGELGRKHVFLTPPEKEWLRRCIREAIDGSISWSGYENSLRLAGVNSRDCLRANLSLRPRRGDWRIDITDPRSRCRPKHLGAARSYRNSRRGGRSWREICTPSK
jgi:hypothetical protein